MLTQIYKYYQRFSKDPFLIKLLESLTLPCKSCLMLTWLCHVGFCRVVCPFFRTVISQSIFMACLLQASQYGVNVLRWTCFLVRYFNCNFDKNAHPRVGIIL